MERRGDLTGARILVLEDDLMQALELSVSLSEAGAMVVGPVADLDEASRLVDDPGCDAAIVDLRLRDRNATALARQLLASRIPFLIYTGYPDSAFFKSDWPGHQLVLKPASINDIIQRISDLLAWRRTTSD
jgi:DNA-binding NarL/FixJ family response regulator